MSWARVSKTLDTSEFVKKLISPLQKVPHCTSTLLPLPLKEKHSTWRCPANCHNGLGDGWPLRKKKCQSIYPTSSKLVRYHVFSRSKKLKISSQSTQISEFRPFNLSNIVSESYPFQGLEKIDITLPSLGKGLPSQPRRTFHLAASWSGCWP